jgi:exosortase/archaeosortase family protein
MDRAEGITPMRAAAYVAAFIAIALAFTLVSTGWLEELTAQTTSAALSLLGLRSTWATGASSPSLTLLGYRAVTVAIIRECTAINVFSVMTALIIPLAAGWARKAEGIALSAILLYGMNVSRIALTVYLAAYDAPPFSWFVTNPTVETYHYPISFVYGVIGVAALILIVSRWPLPELADTLIGVISLPWRAAGRRMHSSP